MTDSLPQTLIEALPRFHRALGRPRNIIIVDARERTPSLYAAYFRAWLHNGLRVLPLANRGLNDVDADDRTKLLLVLRQGRSLSKPIKAFINRQRSDNYDIACVSGDDAVLRFVEQLPEHVGDWQANAAQTSINLTGATPQTVNPAILPLQLPVTSSLRADPHAAQFAITAHGPDLPDEQVWFRLEPGFDGFLIIDRDPNLADDAWRVATHRGNGATVTPLRRSEPIVSSAMAAPLDFLAVILDRTCPDNANWRAAFDLINRVANVALALDAQWRSPTDGDTAATPENYNAAIRHGLVEGLQTAFERHLVRTVQGWWFKDLPDAEMANFVLAMDIKEPDVASELAMHSAKACIGAFSIATYSPGLDLWDPVERALEAARKVVAASGARRAGILIVGNSPPTDPAQADSPLAALRVPPGARVACMTRTQSTGWHDALDACAALSVPIFYLFLRHTNFSGVPPSNAENYEVSQRRVQEALAKTVPLKHSVAERDHVRDAVVDAIDGLRDRAWRQHYVVIGKPIEASA